ncbi:hypothetical protein MCEGEM3_01977 [Oxalobacteraceae bacterium]
MPVSVSMPEPAFVNPPLPLITPVMLLFAVFVIATLPEPALILVAFTAAPLTTNDDSALEPPIAPPKVTLPAPALMLRPLLPENV